MSKWSGKTKGFALGYQIFILFIKKFGVRTAYVLLYFVVPCYFIFLPKARRSLYSTFRSIPNFNESKIRNTVYKNFTNLGRVLIDNLSILTKHSAKYSYSQTGEKYLIDLIDNSQAAILISAHLGSWNIAGELLKKQNGAVNVVMFDGEAKKIKKLIERNVGESNYKIIAVKNDFSHLIKIKKAVDNGELICIHADRYIEGAKTINTKIFGKEVFLPSGPFEIASKLNIPYTFVFAIKESIFHYQFSATKPQLSISPQVIADDFANILSQKLSLYPDQWFNYFNIFDNKK
tara:strand:+ start:20117 stop:20986 length:870 start_codon:yes stop_codon:yes gene_type:complete